MSSPNPGNFAENPRGLSDVVHKLARFQNWFCIFALLLSSQVCTAADLESAKRAYAAKDYATAQAV
jgi:hypothetical protein